MSSIVQHSPPARHTLWRLARYARPYVGVLLLAIAAAGFYEGARSLRAWLVKPLFDDVLLAHYAGEAGPGEGFRWLPGWLSEKAPGAGAAEPAADDDDEAAERERVAAKVRESFLNVILAGALILLVIPLAHYGQIYLAAWVMGRVLVDVQQALCAKLLALPLSFHHRVGRGETLSRTTNDATRAHLALDLLFGDLAQSLIALVVGTAILFSISWQLTLTTFVVAPPIALVIAVFGRRIRKTARRRQESLGDVTSRLVEILAGIKVIKAFRAQKVEEASFSRENLRLFRRSMRVVKNRAMSRTLIEGINNAVVIGVLVLGALVLLRGLWGLTPGSLAAFVAVMQSTYRPLKEISKSWTQLMDSLPAAERFFELLDAAAEPADPPDAVRLAGVGRGVRIDKVSFSYGREPVLHDVSLDVKAGEVVALVGRTGAGKTTLVDLLLRFHDPDSGAIEIDGIDLRRIARDSLLDRMAVVTQEPFLFAGTIRDNIRYGRPGASDAEVEAAARAAHVLEFVETMPGGWDTDVGDAGVQLSGGQRQRVTIARAILKNPDILIFDEATSSLDAQSERLVQEAIDSLLAGRTVFVIAHRLSTIRHADRIVVLDQGRVAQSGSHEELVARPGLYRDLVTLQQERA
jgi:subfamily B ATP-binding cassette protein MsbA